MEIEKIGQITTLEQLIEAPDTATGDVFVDGVMQVIKAYKHPTIGKIAEVLGIRRQLLSEIVKIRTGSTIIEILDARNWQKAQYLLTETDLDLNAVARECGYSNHVALNKFALRMGNQTLYEIRNKCERRRWRQNFGYVE